MSDNRKYYYLKLKENYFDDDSIVLLESMQDGILYSYILLKLYLKSLKHGGKLQLDENIPYTPQMIATLTRQQARMALQAQKKRGGQMGGHLSDIHPPEIEKEIELEKERELEKGQTARSYGRYQNVILSDKDLSELQEELPDLWQTYIDRLSEYMASTGKQYQNHAATIRRWAAEDRKKAAPPTRNRDYSVKEDETV
ncbi:phage replisome organizer N-terminal domain-containing protein [Enterocloster clostridioformis]|uniref:phage replisome organizer N-terminal domain-containing protein n=2 Tax=Enterocloster clostridioformis TaxID=1531 RepID=UPI0034A3BAF7